MTAPPPPETPGHGALPGTEASETVAWLSGQLTPITVLGIGITELPPGWGELSALTQFVGCDPLAPETPADTAGSGHRVRAVAVSPYGGREELNVTRARDRSSLLEPHHVLLARYGGAADFEVCERRSVPAVTLPRLREEHGPFDVLRLHGAGLEYQLLSSGLETVREAVCVEVAGALVDQYVGQYPLPVVAPLLHGAGYSLVDLTTTARPRPGWEGTGHQPLEYRGLWLKDDLLHRTRDTGLTQAVKLLTLSRFLGYHAFGHELAVSLHDRSLLPDAQARTLRSAAFWSSPWPLK